MTIRRKIIDLLKHEALTIRAISRQAGIPEKDVAAHLPHIQSTVKAEGQRLVVEPCVCLCCGYVFKERRRFTRPGRCPACRGERIEDAMFFIR